MAAQIPEKVTMPVNSTWHPFNNLTQPNLTADSGTSNTTTLRSRIEVTISGRVVYRPLSKK